MRRLVIASILLAASVLALAAPPFAHALCKNTYGGDVISPKNVSCGKARAVVRTWARKYKDSGGDVNHRAKGFSCRGSNSSVEGLVIRCTRGDASVRFYANVP